jgi:hypothetical protein
MILPLAAIAKAASALVQMKVKIGTKMERLTVRTFAHMTQRKHIQASVVVQLLIKLSGLHLQTTS